MKKELKDKINKLKAEAYDTMVLQANKITAHEKQMKALNKRRQEIGAELAGIEE